MKVAQPRIACFMIVTVSILRPLPVAGWAQTLGSAITGE